MTRFAWLQTRTQTLVAAGLLAALAVAAAITGIHLSHLFHSLVASCKVDCSLSSQQFLSHDHFMNNLLDILARAVPALVGIFWGAPLFTRDLESGTYRMAWTQTVTRARWTSTKIALGAVATLLLSGLLTLTITWWYRALDPVASNRYMVFDRRDIVPIAYALFAFAAGAVLGVIIRRTVPAMAAALGVFVFARVAVQTWVRPHLLRSTTHFESLANGNQFGIASNNGSVTAVVASGDGPPNSWTLASHIYTQAGRPATLAQRVNFVRTHCPDLSNAPSPPNGHALTAVPVPSDGQTCLNEAAHTFKLAVTYLPSHSYWPLQWLESGIFIGLAALCSVGCFWWVTHRTG
ncbi:MAG: hypothetical protein ACTHK4_15030 [Mycobacteriales bacterium]